MTIANIQHAQRVSAYFDFGFFAHTQQHIADGGTTDLDDFEQITLGALPPLPEFAIESNPGVAAKISYRDYYETRLEGKDIVYNFLYATSPDYVHSINITFAAGTYPFAWDVETYFENGRQWDRLTIKNPDDGLFLPDRNFTVTQHVYYTDTALQFIYNTHYTIKENSKIDVYLPLLKDGGLLGRKFEVNANNHADALAALSTQANSLTRQMSDIERKIGEAEAKFKAGYDDLKELGVDTLVYEGGLFKAGLKAAGQALAKQALFDTISDVVEIYKGTIDFAGAFKEGAMEVIGEGLNLGLSIAELFARKNAVVTGISGLAVAFEAGVLVTGLNSLQQQIAALKQAQELMQLQQEGFAKAVADIKAVTGAMSVSRMLHSEFQGRADGDIVSFDLGSQKIVEVSGAFYRTGSASEIILGNGSDQTIEVSGSASVRINLAGGFDIIDLSSSRTETTVGRFDDVVVYTTKNGFGMLEGVERIVLDDAIVALDINGNAGQAYRLYQAAFERTPDNEGLKYWIGRMDDGDTTLAAIAESFLNSPEFTRTYGTQDTVSNARFVELLYTHTLGREFDQEGYNYWVGKLDASSTNRRDLLAFFSESNENKGKVADVIADGIWLT